MNRGNLNRIYSLMKLVSTQIFKLLRVIYLVNRWKITRLVGRDWTSSFPCYNGWSIQVIRAKTEKRSRTMRRLIQLMNCFGITDSRVRLNIKKVVTTESPTDWIPFKTHLLSQGLYFHLAQAFSAIELEQVVVGSNAAAKCEWVDQRVTHLAHASNI